MKNLRNILLLILFGSIVLSANANEMELPSNIFSQSSQSVTDKTMSIEIIVNGGTTKILLDNVPTSGYLEVYSILGVKLTSVNLKTVLGSCPLELPKGIYIIKAGKVAQKIIVR